MTISQHGVPLIPLTGRPRFAKKLLAVWRLHHLATGDELSILISPGEWPEGQPREVRGIPVREWSALPAGMMWVLGRKGESWYGATQLADTLSADWSVDELALTTGYTEVPPDGGPVKIWLHPDPETGDVPMWAARRD